MEVAFDARRGRRAGAARWVCASDFEHRGAHPRKRRPANENVTSDETVEVRGGRRHSRDATAMGVFCLYIRVKLKREMIPEFKERWGILAKHVRENEPETFSYELCASDQNDDEFMIVEVCPPRKPSTLIPPSSPSPLPTRPLRAEIPLPRAAGGPAPDQRALQGVQGVVDQLRRGFGKVGHELRGDGHRIRRQVTSRATPFATRRQSFRFRSYAFRLQYYLGVWKHRQRRRLRRVAPPAPPRGLARGPSVELREPFAVGFNRRRRRCP